MSPLCAHRSLKGSPYLGSWTPEAISADMGRRMRFDAVGCPKPLLPIANLWRMSEPSRQQYDGGGRGFRRPFDQTTVAHKEALDHMAARMNGEAIW